VEATAVQFLEQVREAWQLEEPLAEQLLRWASRLHEIGLDISHSHHHKHGAYLLQHADMPGFPREEQQVLAAVVGSHRRKLRLEQLEELLPPWHVKAEYLIVLLRLAVLLHRGREPRALPPVTLEAKERSLSIGFPEGWLDAHPLTLADLERETNALQAAGIRLRLR
jgi:exopolyphosphatase/guanosine-5'-triphosphate,3'-diphosphate pyrophosphatase